jgi:serine/threonine protein kinase
MINNIKNININNTLIGQKYKLIEMIGKGSYGFIAKAKHVRTNEEVAIKIEEKASSTKLLKYEAQIYLLLNKEENKTGFPNIKWFGKDEMFFYMVMELLGQSLSTFKTGGDNDLSLSLDIVLKIGGQIVDRLHALHITGLIHRDIKPDNLLFGLGRNNNVIHLIDMGFCKGYINKDSEHVPCKTGQSIIGTPNFISINMHNGLSLSRRDDLESVMYVLIYLYHPLYEWKNIFKDDLKDEEIKNIKLSLLDNDKIPIQLLEALKYCRLLNYHETPDYEKIKKILQ